MVNFPAEFAMGEVQLRVCTSGLYLLPSAGRVVDLVRLNVFHDTNSSHHQLDPVGRVLHGLDNGNVSGLGEEGRE